MPSIPKYLQGTIAAGATLTIYSTIYVILSIRGAYEPAVIGLNGVKWYEWAPRGFIIRDKPGKLGSRPMLFYAFMPLYWLDLKFWHTEDKSYKGKYPVHDLNYVG